jgi:hypothetical protein
MNITDGLWWARYTDNGRVTGAPLKPVEVHTYIWADGREERQVYVLGNEQEFSLEDFEFIKPCVA